VVLDDSAMEAMSVDDLTAGARRGFGVFVNDLVLVGRPWRFRLADVRVPVRGWHGDADRLCRSTRLGAPLRCSQTSSCTCARARATSAGFVVADEMLATLADLWRQRTGS
jgi:hypothetical protein